MGELIAAAMRWLFKVIPLKVLACTTFWLFIIGYLLALGYMPNVFPGFARNDAMVQMRATLDEDAADELRAQQCKMASGPGKTLYTQTIQKRQEDYQRLTHEPLNIPACGDL